MNDTAQCLLSRELQSVIWRASPSLTLSIPRFHPLERTGQEVWRPQQQPGGGNRNGAGAWLGGGRGGKGRWPVASPPMGASRQNRLALGHEHAVRIRPGEGSSARVQGKQVGVVPPPPSAGLHQTVYYVGYFILPCLQDTYMNFLL